LEQPESRRQLRPPQRDVACTAPASAMAQPPMSSSSCSGTHDVGALSLRCDVAESELESLSARLLVLCAVGTATPLPPSPALAALRAANDALRRELDTTLAELRGTKGHGTVSVSEAAVAATPITTPHHTTLQKMYQGGHANDDHDDHTHGGPQVDQRALDSVAADVDGVEGESDFDADIHVDASDAAHAAAVGDNSQGVKLGHGVLQRSAASVRGAGAAIDADSDTADGGVDIGLHAAVCRIRRRGAIKRKRHVHKGVPSLRSLAAAEVRSSLLAGTEQQKRSVSWTHPSSRIHSPTHPSIRAAATTTATCTRTRTRTCASCAHMSALACYDKHQQNLLTSQSSISQPFRSVLFLC
jgi:hypothetical protein